ncbi:alpha/beta hydrolase family protein [Leptolyngbya sp. 7M]|uniref:S9 family peptidase n=1 Tax=Leptolyngbya sp. 7M TaxID=2812896 RepID=UPI001B8B27E4|nr:S9 family peptidase [Leptolyngbya sp. 7M]QYO66525.1 S9 family peptidase [Leptolyngbya sp. 7M]
MRRTNVLAALLLFAAAAFAQPYTIQQYLSIKSAGGPTFSPDGKQLAYTTNTTGTSQVWLIDLPQGKPRQLTNYEDNVSFVRWLPDGSGLIFGKARGGDENTQFFYMKPDGSGVRALTDDPRVRHNFGQISFDGKTIYYGSNKRDRNYFDIYRMDIASGKEELIYQFDSNNSVAAVDQFGKKLVVSRSGGELSLDNNLFLVDVASKKETLITPHTGSAQFGDAGFLPDGKSLVFAQNDNREFYSLSHMRLRNPARPDDWSDANREVRILDDTQWDISGIELPDYASRFAYVINREGFSELYIKEIETDGKPLLTTFLNRKTKVELPAQGIIGGLAFSKDQDKLAFSFSSSKHNGDIWIYHIESKKLTQVTQSDRAGIDPATFIVPELIKFKTFDGREIPAWFYRPKLNENRPRNPSDDGPRQRGNTATAYSVIVSIHGGPEGQSRPGFNPLFQYYLSRGYAVLDPNVRGSTGYGKTYTHLDDVEKREDSVKDIAAAHQWLTTKGGADPRRIAVMGGSYGGYMTMAAITLYPDLWAAAVNTVGIVNWETFLQNTSGYRRRQREVEYGRLDRDIEFLRRISPIRKIDRIKTPLFVIHGKNDPRVPYTEAEQVVKALRERNAIVEYKLYDDEGHGISKLKNRLELYPLVADFLDRYLK